MYLPKKDIKNSLETLGYSVLQTNQTVFNDLPAITFSIGNNQIEKDLDNNISTQNLEIVIHIWAEGSAEASAVLSEVEEVMRNKKYKMSYSSDIPNEGNLHHISCRFTRTI